MEKGRSYPNATGRSNPFPLRARALQYEVLAQKMKKKKKKFEIPREYRCFVCHILIVQQIGGLTGRQMYQQVLRHYQLAHPKHRLAPLIVTGS